MQNEQYLLLPNSRNYGVYSVKNCVCYANIELSVVGVGLEDTFKKNHSTIVGILFRLSEKDQKGE